MGEVSQCVATIRFVEIHGFDDIIGAVRVRGEMDGPFPELEKDDEAAEAVRVG